MSLAQIGSAYMITNYVAMESFKMVRNVMMLLQLIFMVVGIVDLIVKSFVLTVSEESAYNATQMVG